MTRNWAKIGPKWAKNSIFGHNSKFYHLIFLIFCMKLMQVMTNDMVQLACSRKFSMGGKTCSKWAKIAVFVIYQFWLFKHPLIYEWSKMITWWSWLCNFFIPGGLRLAKIMPKMSKNGVFWHKSELWHSFYLIFCKWILNYTSNYVTLFWLITRFGLTCKACSKWAARPTFVNY